MTRLRGIHALLALLVTAAVGPGATYAHGRPAATTPTYAPGRAAPARGDAAGTMGALDPAVATVPTHTSGTATATRTGATKASGVLDPVTEPQKPADTLSAEARAAADAIRVYLITMGPGDAVWERFGHNAIRIEDRARGVDVTYNYGMFDFGAPDFYPRFLRGDMLYWMQGFDTWATAEAYARANRSVYAQELNLTAEQKLRLRDFLEWNSREENRYYPYDYYRDNCSTRVRDALDYALGGQLRAALDTIATGTTYRSHTRRLTADDLPVYTGLNLAMGKAIDQPLSAWEESFLPLALREHVRNVQVRDENGTLVPLVRAERVLFEAMRAPAPAEAPDRRVGYLVAGILLGATFLAFGRLAADDRTAGRIGLAIAGGAWALVTGILGTVIALLWALTNHTVTYGNENLLQVNPLLLALVVLLPAAVLRRRPMEWRDEEEDADTAPATSPTRAGGSARIPWPARMAQRVAWIVALASAAGLLIQLVPGFDQVNGEIIALALPANLGLAGALRLALRANDAARPERARRDAVTAT